MQLLAILLIAVIIVLWVLRKAAHVPPARLAKLVKQGGGLAALAASIPLFVRGRYDLGLGLGGVGLWLLGMAAAPEWTKHFRKAGSAQTGVSRVRSAMIEMELDHKSGTIEGSVLAGLFEGNRLADLNQEQCQLLYRTCLADDPDGARLLETYFDRRFPGWRAANDGQAHAGSGGGGRSQGSSAMSEDEAYEILGLQKGATRDDISRAHRALMKKLHPDHGGTTSLAAKVNEAKDVLMRRHT
jgi:hypothetical protein